MKKVQIKIVVTVLMIMLSTLLVTTCVFAEETKNVQIVKTDANYVIYVEGMLKTEFKYATSDNDLPSDSIDLQYINAITDEEGNKVVLLENEAKYLYVKEASGASKVELNFDNSISVEKIAEIEEITNRIPTKSITVEKKNEEVDGVKYEETVGALQIDEEYNKNVTYEYASIKLPNEKYDTLKALTDELGSKYNESDMYGKVELAKRYNKELEKVLAEVEWKEVENMVVEQPADANADEEFIVLLKKTSKEETSVYDVKFMKSGKTEVKPEITKVTNVVKRTAKLPITGDSLILFGILMVIVVAIVIVAIRMKKIKDKNI